MGALVASSAFLLLWCFCGRLTVSALKSPTSASTEPLASSTNLKIKRIQRNIFFNYFLFHFLILPRLTRETAKILNFQHLLNFCLFFTPRVF